MRKSIDVNEALFSKKSMNMRILNEIMVSLRKMIKLVKKAQSLSLLENADSVEEDDIKAELDKVCKKVQEYING